MNKLLDLTVHHFRIGCTRELLIAETALLTLLILDYGRFSGLGLCLTAPFWLAQVNFAPYLTSAGLTMLFLILVPVAVAAGRVLFAIPGKFGVGEGSAVAAHIVLSLLLGYGALVIVNLRTLAGREYSIEKSSGYVFHPWFGGWLPDFSSWILQGLFSTGGAITSLVGLGSIMSVLLWLWYGDTPEVVKDYINACRLADLDSAYVPIDGVARLNFAEPVLAAEVPFIKNARERRVREYFRQMPGTEEATAYLDKLHKDCLSLLRSVLEIPLSVRNENIELYSTTGRAVEVALSRFNQPINILISPYEHRSLSYVVDWFGTRPGVTVRKLSKADIDNSQGQWNSPQAGFGDLLDRERTNVLIISEVNLGTGMIIPVANIVDTIRRSFPSKLSLP